MSDATPTKQLVLPLQIVGSIDLARIIRELEGLDDFLQQSAIRTPGVATGIHRTSQVLDEFVTANGISVLDARERTWLIETARVYRDKAPQIHMSFAVDPSAAFTEKMVSWLRENIYPFILLEVGLQPTIAAGCVVRTTNHIFDMSLRHHFQDNRDLLVQELREAK